MKVFIYIDVVPKEGGADTHHVQVDVGNDASKIFDAAPGEPKRFLVHEFWMPRDQPDHDNYIVARALEHVVDLMKHHGLSYKEIFPLDYEIV
jgi:hypothetical protein